MSYKESQDVRGQLTLRKYALDGRLVEEVSKHNGITSMGRRLL